MKRTFIIGLLISILSLNLNSQSNKSKSSSLTPSEAKPNTFKKGQIDLNIGIGLGRTAYYGSGYQSATPPLSVSLDYGITKNISIGGFLGYTRTKWSYTGISYHNGNNFYDYTDTYSWNYYIVGIRGAFHIAEYLQVENLDVYGGLMLGNAFAKYTYSTTDPYFNRSGSYTSNSGGFVWGLYVGGRYMFTNRFGAFGEFGYGLSYATIGLNIKL